MDELIQQHLEAVEKLQADLEERIREALGTIDAKEILERADELPHEIAEELREWIETHMLAPLQDEAVRFVDEIDDDIDPESVDEDAIHKHILVLLDSYEQQVVTLATAALAEIANQASLQQTLGRSLEAIEADLTARRSALGIRFTGFENALVSQTDSFVNSAAGAFVTGLSTGDYTWIVVLDSRECNDCHGRHGETRSYEEWIEAGLPRTGWSVCGGRCRCILISAKAYAQSSTGPVQRKRR